MPGKLDLSNPSGRVLGFSGLPTAGHSDATGRSGAAWVADNREAVERADAYQGPREWRCMASVAAEPRSADALSGVTVSAFTGLLVV